MDAFGAERWWPALLLVALTAALLGLACRARRTPRLRRWLAAGPSGSPGCLTLARDAGRTGPTPAAGLLIGWAVGLSALGLLYGAVIPTIPDLVASNPDIARAIGASANAEQALINAFLRYIFLFMAVILDRVRRFVGASMRAEEEAGRAEMVLATPLARTSWVVATVLVTCLGALLLTLLMGMGLAVGYGLGMGRWDRIAGQLGGQLSYLPGVLVVAAVAVAIAGLLPRWSVLAWAVVAFVFLQVLLGETLRLPDWVDAISPFWHLPGLPVETFEPTPAVAQLILAAALMMLGLGAMHAETFQPADGGRERRLSAGGLSEAGATLRASLVLISRPVSRVDEDSHAGVSTLVEHPRPLTTTRLTGSMPQP
jgi:ABC-2 type transport system permease protein